MYYYRVKSEKEKEEIYDKLLSMVGRKSVTSRGCFLMGTTKYTPSFDDIVIPDSNSLIDTYQQEYTRGYQEVTLEEFFSLIKLIHV